MGDMPYQVTAKGYIYGGAPGICSASDPDGQSKMDSMKPSGSVEIPGARFLSLLRSEGA